jgi:hypothetical protein
MSYGSIQIRKLSRNRFESPVVKPAAVAATGQEQFCRQGEIIAYNSVFRKKISTLEFKTAGDRSERPPPIR